ncbi:MAG TPA: hypothetical protein VFY92_06965 [Hyphomicrobiaceae bacterium]|nr:hypothetical protein [Hyphomicrobiaceae bacterium]
MEDGQLPPDADSHADEQKGDPARRAGLRLRDAEAVATTRRDLFGDGSLVDVLAGDRDPSAGDQEPTHADDASAQPAGVPQEPPQPTEEAPARLDAPPSSDAESLDAIIDSFPAEPPRTNTEPEPAADPSFLAASPFSFRPAQGESRDGAPRQGAFERFQVSAIFQGLGPADDVSTDPRDVEAPSTDAGEGGIAPEASAPADIEPPQQDTAADSVEPNNGLASAQQQGPPGPAPMLGLDAWPPFPEPPDSAAEEPAREAGALPASPGVPPPMPHPSDWPPFPEPPGAQVDQPLQQDTKDQPYLGTPAWPPLPDMQGGAGDAPATIPAGLPPYIELPAASASDGEQHYAEDAGAPPFPKSAAEAEDDEPFAGSGDHPPLFPEAPMPAPPARYPGEAGEEAGVGLSDSHVAEAAPPRLAFDAAARASDETTAKIAAEANATARALNSLQNMLSPSVPHPEPSQPPAQLEVEREPEAPFGSAHRLYQGAPLNMQGDPAPFPDIEPARYLPRPQSSDLDQGKRVYLLGFATGLVLSVVAGIALYVLLAMGT